MLLFYNNSCQGGSPWTPRRGGQAWRGHGSARRSGGRARWVRVTEAEAEVLRERAQAARVSMGAYLRRRALGQRERIAAQRRLGASELRELNRIGVNLNQMARANELRGGGPGGDPGGARAGGRASGRVAGRGDGVMVVKMAAAGRSFGGVADYCLHDRLVPGEAHPESAERVEWTETRNVATNHGERAATAEAGPELKRLAGEAATGRKLEKPVCIGQYQTPSTGTSCSHARIDRPRRCRPAREPPPRARTHSRDEPYRDATRPACRWAEETT